MRILLLETLVLPAPPSGTITYPGGAHTNVDDEVGAAWIAEGKAAPDSFESLEAHAAHKRVMKLEAALAEEAAKAAEVIKAGEVAAEEAAKVEIPQAFLARRSRKALAETIEAEAVADAQAKVE